MSTPIKIGLWIESFLIAYGLEKFIDNQPDVEIVWHKEDLEKASLIEPQVLILYSPTYMMDEINRIRAPKVLITEKKRFNMKELRGCGISGVVPVNVSPQLLLTAIHCVKTSNSYIHPDIHAVEHSGDPLSKREREILTLLAQGKQVKEVASILEISVKTAEAHKFNLMRKLDIHNKVDLVKYALANGFIELNQV